MLKTDWLKAGMGLLAVLGLLLVGGYQGQAASQNAATSGRVSFSVAPQLPANQRDGNRSFFDLTMRMGTTQRLSATIYNHSDRDIRVTTAIHTASTNQNGTIEYVQAPTTYDPSLKYRLDATTKLTGPATVTVPANGNKVVSAIVRLPAGAFHGVMLGGWYFQLVDQKATGTVAGATNVKNQYSYVIAMRYTVGQVPTPRLELADVKPGLLNAHHGIFPRVRNVQPAMLMGLDVQTKVTRKSDGQSMRADRKTGVQFAPNSAFRYPLLAGSTPLAAGEYHLHMIVKNRAHRWVFDRDFTVSARDAHHYNQQSVDPLPKSPWYLLLVGAAGMFVIMLIVWWLVAWRRKHRAATEDQTND
ncbi:DUF916 and DUF3324 domain-containing protein [Lactiplantibacillus modestisalitolerans]|uniref:DUF916 and DUF3324 domain-containing protein n=1 Tax=Lactiplantibacillus modestisalitolerans TaxID=1457219 RepID=A0ABV5WRS5_9LACO|nr:DUF916 and DUF3324 domain-containing protein [Lactiplantibacillus modestisalitolerans]